MQVAGVYLKNVDTGKQQSAPDGGWKLLCTLEGLGGMIRKQKLEVNMFFICEAMLPMLLLIATNMNG